jgi:hypothetical protein
VNDDTRVRIQRTIQNVFRTNEWRRIRMTIDSQEHDADREAIVKEVRRILTNDLTKFRGKEPQ